MVRAGGYGTHHPHEHIKHPFINISGIVLTETNWKLAERLQYNQGCKKYPHRELGRKGREVIRLGPVTLWGVSEGKIQYMSRDSPWVRGSSHTLGPQPWGPIQGRPAPLAGWWANGTNKRAVGSLDSNCEEQASVGLLIWQGGEGRLRSLSGAAQCSATATTRIPGSAKRT